MKIKNLITLLFLLLAYSHVTVYANDDESNTIQPGRAKFTLRLNVFSRQGSNSGDNVNVDSLLNIIDIYCATKSVFDTTTVETLIPLNRDRNIFFQEIPVECKEEIAGIRVYNNSEFRGGSLFMLKQDRINSIDLYMTPYGEILGAEYDELKVPDWMNIASVGQNALSANPFMFIPSDTEMYDKSWKNVVKFQTDSVWPKFLSQATDYLTISPEISGWINNNVKKQFATFCILPYVKNAEKLAHKTVSEPPMAAYSFLDSIDYSPEIFLKGDLLFPMGWFLSAILDYPCGGMENIGDMPVDKWEKKIGKKLQQAIPQPSPLLLDLLSGMSYIKQIDEGKPLTEKQIKNIKEGYTDGIGEIVLARNEKLLAAQKQKETLNLYDLSNNTYFDLKEFIDEHYAGKPVVVDFWNTWCSPCMAAISQTEDIRRDLADTDIIFLYIADTSSKDEEWQKHAKTIGSEQLRISKELSGIILDSNRLHGFPSYMFFDRNHNIVHSQTSFPGPIRYQDLLNSLND